MAEAPDLTRRGLVGALAGAAAASLALPTQSLAGSLRGGESVSSRWIGSLSGTPAPVSWRRFVMAGVEWTGPAEARIELRARALNGRWSPWALASTPGHEPDRSREAGRRGRLFGEPVWTGTADQVQLRSDRPVHGVRLAFVSVPLDTGMATAATALPRALPVLDAGPGQPPIIARSAWARGRARPRHEPEYGSVKLAFVHHTASPNGYGAGEVPAMLAAIFAYHVHVRGWWDIGYNFAVDRFGRIWEARAGGIDMAVVGAQAGGYNAESTGAAMLGDFMNAVPSAAADRALERLIAWKLSLHGAPTHGRVKVVVDPADAFYTPFRPGEHVWLPRVAGHRQGDTTDCPGNALFAQLPAIRPRIKRLAGTAARITLSRPAGVLTAGTPVPLSGRLASLTGTPLGDAPIQLQELRNGATRMIAQVTTDAAGAWSADLDLRSDTVLRAVHPAWPATVSDWTELPVAPLITLQLVSSAPLAISGTISPSRPQVMIDVYTAAKPHGHPILRHRLAVRDGEFSGELSVDRTGDFVLVARSSKDSENAAGASAPLAVTLS